MTPAARLRACAVLALLVSLMRSGDAAAAQTTNATLQGTITDTSGAVLPGVTVKLESPATGLSRDVVTNAAGVYVINFLPAGSYVVSAELSRIQDRTHDQVRLEVGQNLELDLRMEIGQLDEVVNVEATAAVTRSQLGRDRHRHPVEPVEGAPAGRPPLGGFDAAGARRNQYRRRDAPQHAIRRPRP